ncbi:MAG: aminomethyl-transferring glycine dehydrogenase [Myxococcota bacterium]|nr:aminomethyl-transferring glycine dehydrogenase [Myxococcota bacterium]
MVAHSILDPTDTFVHRHIGPSDEDVAAMLETLGLDSLDMLIDQTVPAGIRLNRGLEIGPARSESQVLEELRAVAEQNQVFRSLLGLGYSDCIVPPVIQRNILENPGWYTQYTPYQAEISQGRLEALVNFQTMIADLCALPLANASLLDEGTAAAEAMAMANSITRGKRSAFFVAESCHPQTLAVVQTRAEPLGIAIQVGDPLEADFEDLDVFGVLVQYPNSDGRIEDYDAMAQRAHEAGAIVIAATDLLALTLLKPPGEWGADIAIGNSQRFGVPLGFGGPHAAFLATTEVHARKCPGRIIGQSIDSEGNPAYRLALQTREQHIRRDRATSNICTAQVLLAIMASMYGVYHGAEGLTAIARRVHGLTRALAHGLTEQGFKLAHNSFFDTLKILNPPDDILETAQGALINLRAFPDGSVGIALDEKSDRLEVVGLLELFGVHEADCDALLELAAPATPSGLERSSSFLTAAVFKNHRSEHEMLRYIYKLQGRDLSLATSMIPLGSCTMKLNGTSEMLPVTWPEFANLHPFVPAEQSQGYRQLFASLEGWLAELTGFSAISLQPNAGSQGEYAGLLTIRAWHQSRGETGRNVCLIPVSAHGTNPASAVMAGFRVAAVACDSDGNIDLDDLKARCAEHSAELGALMITYPSTHGVFEEAVEEICATVHDFGGLVYMDGANMNAQVGLCRPADMGADVCHLNLHKTFCIPHGGGGPGMGPIGVTERLAPFLPSHPFADVGGEQAVGPISAAPWGSPAILPISYVYIALMGSEGLKRATQVAILNANYMAERLSSHYEILYTGHNGRCAHEFVLDARPFKVSAGVTVDDIAKRLMDYGFHAPTMSWPVPGTLMVEPTESESKRELDRFCDAMISIRAEIRAIEENRSDAEDNPLKGAPHTAKEIASDEWKHGYPREQAAYPAPWLRDNKFWPPVARVDNAYGDRNLVCTCPSVEEMMD